MEDTALFKIVNCEEEGGFWIEGPDGRMGVCFLVEDDAETFVMNLETGAAAERARLRSLLERLRARLVEAHERGERHYNDDPLLADLRRELKEGH